MILTPFIRRSDKSSTPRQEASRHAVVQRRSTAGIRPVSLALVLAPALLLGACAEQITKRGQHFRENDIRQVQPGLGKEQVRAILGTPTSTTTTNSGKVYYYISSVEKKSAFFTPSEVDRKVLAVYFTPVGTVERVANYGLQDGKVFDFVSRTTPAPGGHEDGLIKQLFRNLGTKQIFGE
jgi:outer membrane protein assembly factor BamE (lipoprotein component of BamABCDE complex)